MGRCMLLGSLNSFLSYAPQLSGANPVSLFTLRSGPSGRWLLLAFPQLLSNHHGVWQRPLDLSFGSPHSLSEARNRGRLWHFLFVDMAGAICISPKGGGLSFLFFKKKEAKRAVTNPVQVEIKRIWPRGAGVGREKIKGWSAAEWLPVLSWQSRG